ncbi:MAG: hypothetical protein AAF355_12165 [Myxococcota bacterium]
MTRNTHFITASRHGLADLEGLLQQEGCAIGFLNYGLGGPDRSAVGIGYFARLREKASAAHMEGCSAVSRPALCARGWAQVVDSGGGLRWWAQVVGSGGELDGAPKRALLIL